MNPFATHFPLLYKYAPHSSYAEAMACTSKQRWAVLHNEQDVGEYTSKWIRCNLSYFMLNTHNEMDKRKFPDLVVNDVGLENWD